MDYSSPGSTVQGILQARILEWVARPSCRGSSISEIKPASPVSPALAGRFFTTSATWEALDYGHNWWKALTAGLWNPGHCVCIQVMPLPGVLSQWMIMTGILRQLFPGDSGTSDRSSEWRTPHGSCQTLPYHLPSLCPSQGPDLNHDLLSLLVYFSIFPPRCFPSKYPAYQIILIYISHTTEINTVWQRLCAWWVHMC